MPMVPCLTDKWWVSVAQGCGSQHPVRKSSGFVRDRGECNNHANKQPYLTNQFFSLFFFLIRRTALLFCGQSTICEIAWDFGFQVVSFVWILVHLVQTSFMALPNTTFHYSSLIGGLEQCLCVCVYVCVRERQKERETERDLVFCITSATSHVTSATHSRPPSHSFLGVVLVLKCWGWDS